MSTLQGFWILPCTILSLPDYSLSDFLRSGGPSVKRRRLDNGEEVSVMLHSTLLERLTYIQRYAQLDLEDLHDNQSSIGIVLDMKDSQRYFDGRAIGTEQGDGEGPVCRLRLRDPAVTY